MVGSHSSFRDETVHETMPGAGRPSISTASANAPLGRTIASASTDAVGATAGSADDSPTGPEIVDLLAEAVGKVRADAALSGRCVREGLVPTLYALEGLGEAKLWSWLQEMCDNNMLRLFGIAPS